jgi:hypothetical protein
MWCGTQVECLTAQPERKDIPRPVSCTGTQSKCIYLTILGTFTKFRKVTVSFVVFVGPSVRPAGFPHETTQLSPDGFSWNLIYEYFSKKKTSSKFKFHYNRKCITGTLHEDQYIFLILSRWVLLRTKNVLDKSCRGNQNTHFMFSKVFFLKACPIWNNVEKYCRIWQATDGKMENAHCILGT